MYLFLILFSLFLFVIGFVQFVNGKTNVPQVLHPGSTDEATGRIKFDEEEDEDIDTIMGKLKNR